MKNTTKKPIIGLIPLWDDTKNSIWMLPGYINAVLHAGGIPIVLPLTDDQTILTAACDTCSGFILTGGHDVDPALYGETMRENCGTICTLRDAMEKTVLSYALDRDLPVLGICRGHQYMNAVLGGTLFQDLPSQHPSDITHRMLPPYDLPAHTVNIISDTPLHALLDVSVLPVNSRHHQAINKIAPVLKPMAVSGDGLIEAVYMPKKRFVWGVQWHPEHSYKTEPSSLAIFEAFIKASTL